MRLLKNITTAGVGTPVSVKSRDTSQGRDELMVQVSISGGTATVRLWGRLASDMPLVQLGSDQTASGLISVARVAEMQADVTAISGATVNVEVLSD